MKKNIMLLFGLFLGASNINCFSVKINDKAVNCIVTRVKQSELVKECGDLIADIIGSYPNYDALELAKSLFSKDNRSCRNFLTNTVVSFADCGQLLSF